MANEAYMQFMRDPDLPARRREVSIFFGPHADKYLAVFDRMHAAANRPVGEKLKFSLAGNGFNAAAFFLGPVWFFYRKLWIYAWSITALIVVVGLLPAGARLGLPISVGLAANQLYVGHSVATIAKMHAAGGELSAEQLARAGGVSTTAGWIAGGCCALLFLLGIVGLILQTHNR